MRWRRARSRPPTGRPVIKVTEPAARGAYLGDIPAALLESPMKKNVGSADKIVRIVLGLGLLSLLFLLEAPMKYFGLIGLVPLLTSLMGWCPLYTLLGVNTCKVKA